MLEQTIKIKSYDVHPNGVVKISALQKYMQQIAREDSDSYGATYAKMRDANMVFVITRLAMEFERPLRDEDIVTIRTINNRLEGASFVREFLFFSGGEQVAAATTLWALLDFEKRSILRPSALPFTIPALNLPVPGIPVQKRLTERGTVLTPSGARWRFPIWTKTTISTTRITRTSSPILRPCLCTTTGSAACRSRFSRRRGWATRWPSACRNARAAFC